MDSARQVDIFSPVGITGDQDHGWIKKFEKLEEIWLTDEFQIICFGNLERKRIQFLLIEFLFQNNRDLPHYRTFKPFSSYPKQKNIIGINLSDFQPYNFKFRTRQTSNFLCSVNIFKVLLKFSLLNFNKAHSIIFQPQHISFRLKLSKRQQK